MVNNYAPERGHNSKFIMKFNTIINGKVLLSLCIIGLIFPSSIYTDIVYFITSLFFSVSCAALLIMVLSSQYILSTINQSTIDVLRKNIKDNKISLEQLNTTKEQIDIGHVGIKQLYTNIHLHITFALSIVILSVAYLSHHELRMLYIILSTYLILAAILRYIYTPLLKKLSQKITYHEEKN